MSMHTRHLSARERGRHRDGTAHPFGCRNRLGGVDDAAAPERDDVGRDDAVEHAGGDLVDRPGGDLDDGCRCGFQRWCSLDRSCSAQQRVALTDEIAGRAESVVAEDDRLLAVDVPERSVGQSVVAGASGRA
jgi:hypothetical protein